MIKIPNEVIFAILRVIKKGNPGDQYYEAYLGHLAKRGETFFDLYHFNWAYAIEHKPKRILEIGTRTGISLCQLLSAYIDHSVIEKVICCDLFNDGFITPSLVKYNLKLVGIPQTLIDKVQIITGNSRVEVPSLPKDEKFDYILVDGDHSREGAIADLTNVYPLINKGGVIVFDDIGEDGCGLIDVWNQFKEQHTAEFDWYEDLNGKGLGWAIRK